MQDLVAISGQSGSHTIPRRHRAEDSEIAKRRALGVMQERRAEYSGSPKTIEIWRGTTFCSNPMSIASCAATVCMKLQLLRVFLTTQGVFDEHKQIELPWFQISARFRR
jgi:hypothetical protein